MLKRIADWLIERAKRTPYYYRDKNGVLRFHLYGRDGSPYMARYWLIPYNRFGIAARVHHILRSDEDRHLHDHPWWSISIILRGGYFEEVPAPGIDALFDAEGRMVRLRWRGTGSVIFRRARDWHRLKLPSAGIAPLSGSDARWRNHDCWTLFITGPKRKDHDPEHACWGFLIDGVKVPADVYLGERYVPTDYAGGAKS